MILCHPRVKRGGGAKEPRGHAHFPWQHGLEAQRHGWGGRGCGFCVETSEHEFMHTHIHLRPPAAPPSRIEDYAMLGDCESAALVSRTGSIDWLCWPRFDSGACFAALLGAPSNGRWQIAPTAPEPRITRRYRGETLILETDFETAEGAVRVTDFMPIRGGHSDLVRIVTGLRGRVDMKHARSFCDSRTVTSSHGSPHGRRPAARHRRTGHGHHSSDVKLHGVGRTTVGEFAIAAGRSRRVRDDVGGVASPGARRRSIPYSSLDTTERHWNEWASQCTYQGEWREAVVRSLLTLKSLTYHATGGIVAAPTTSLPEQVGGVRNWDYRYCWLRDATITLLALMNGGYFLEAQAWRDWLVRAAAGSPSQVQIMYGLSGERFLVGVGGPVARGI